jgi:D-sedoheptulose 7-phosphate isomerase
MNLNTWLLGYIDKHKKVISELPLYQISGFIQHLYIAHQNDAQVFVFGNGGSAANASHFSVDLGKGASRALGKPFRVLSLNDNLSWLTAVSNDISYEDVFLCQLQV